MNFSLTPELAKKLRHLKQKQPQTFKKIQKQLHHFQENHLHPSLRNHKLQVNLRMLYYMSENKAVFFLLGNHDEVYRK